jgi:hypothetical protein
MSSQEKRERMLSLVAEWRASGLPQKAFVKLHGISVYALRYWVSRTKEKEPGMGGFIEMTAASALKNDRIEIIYPSGIRLKVSRDLSLISQLIRL